MRFAKGTLGHLLGEEWVREVVAYRRRNEEIRKAIEARRRAGVPPITSSGNRKAEPSLDELDPRGRTQ